MDIRIEYALAALVEGMLPRGHDKECFLKFELHLSYASWKEDKEKTLQYTVPFLFYRPGGYTKVLRGKITGSKIPALLTDYPHLENNLKENEYYCQCDHDSCWRDSGFSFLSILEQSAIEAIGDPSIHPFVSFGILFPTIITGSIEAKSHKNENRIYIFEQTKSDKIQITVNKQDIASITDNHMIDAELSRLSDSKQEDTAIDWSKTFNRVRKAAKL